MHGDVMIGKPIKQNVCKCIHNRNMNILDAAEKIMVGKCECKHPSNPVKFYPDITMTRTLMQYEVTGLLNWLLISKEEPFISIVYIHMHILHNND